MVKIAIVEDETAIADMYKMKLQQAGYEVGVAENGRKGLELCEKMKPDMVLLDLMMPEMNGDEMLEKLRSTGWGKHMKVIVLTNVGEQEAPAKLKELDISAYVVKAEMTPKQVADLTKQQLS